MAPFQMTTPPQLPEHREVELVPVWRLQPYILVSFGVERCSPGYRKETWTSTQPQNPWPTICPACRIFWDNGGSEYVEVANQCLVLTWGPCHELELMPFAAWMARNRRPDSPETLGKTKHDWEKKSTKWFLMIFRKIGTFVQSSSERFPRAAEGCRCRDPRPSIIQRESKLEVSTGSLPSEIGPSHGRGEGKNAGVEVDEGHQKKIAH